VQLSDAVVAKVRIRCEDLLCLERVQSPRRKPDHSPQWLHLEVSELIQTTAGLPTFAQVGSAACDSALETVDGTLRFGRRTLQRSARAGMGDHSAEKEKPQLIHAGSEKSGKDIHVERRKTTHEGNCESTRERSQSRKRGRMERHWQFGDNRVRVASARRLSGRSDAIRHKKHKFCAVALIKQKNVRQSSK
jgi:hypothetical protein